MTGSWRTTAVGVLAGLSLIIGQLTAVFDADPATVFDLEKLIAGLAMLGLGYFARDNKVSSEAAGAK